MGFVDLRTGDAWIVRQNVWRDGFCCERWTSVMTRFSMSWPGD
jgi:hypothetical protein